MTRYRIRDGVRWGVGGVTVALTCAGSGVRVLRYPEAAVWDLLSRGYPVAKVASLTEHIASLDSVAADALVRSCLEEWADRGFVERV